MTSRYVIAAARFVSGAAHAGDAGPITIGVPVSTAAEKCARWRLESVPVGLREKGREALSGFLATRIEARGG